MTNDSLVSDSNMLRYGETTVEASAAQLNPELTDRSDCDVCGEAPAVSPVTINPEGSIAARQVTTLAAFNKEGVSERKLAANRLNAQKSTGPKTVRGKVNSRRNALKHGLLAQKALFDSRGKPQDEGFSVLYQQLCEECPGEDLVTQIFRETLLTAYWRNVKAMHFERELLEWGSGSFGTFSMPNLHRYSVHSQKALQQALKELDLRLAGSRNDETSPLESAVGAEIEAKAQDTTDPHGVGPTIVETTTLRSAAQVEGTDEAVAVPEPAGTLVIATSVQ